MRPHTLAAVVLISIAPAGCFGSSNNPSGPTPDGGGGLDGSPSDAGTAPSEASPDAPAGDAGDAGGGVEAGADAPGDAQAGGSADAGDGAPQPGVYVDPVNGADTNAGTMGAPFKTVKKASQAVAAGQAIYLFGGTYDATNQATMSITFPSDVTLRAMAPNAVTFKFAGGGLTFDGGGIQDVSIQDFGVSSGSIGMAINVTGGTFSTSGVSFSNVGCPVSTTAGSNATVTVDMTGVATPIANVPNSFNCVALWVDGTSSVTWKGGGTINRTWATTPANPVVLARGGSTVTVDGLTVQGYPTVVVGVLDNAHVTVKNSTISGSGATGGLNAIQVGGQNTQVPMTPSLSLDTTSVTGSQGSAILLSLYGTTPETPSLSFTNSHVDGTVNGSGVLVQGAPSNASLSVTVTATGSTFTGNSGYGISSPRANVSISGGDVSGNTSGGVALTDAASANTLKVRGTTLGRNGGDFIALAGSAASALDLGKTADPGGIVFTSVPSGKSAVSLSAPVAGYAVGNTWIANQQGANAAGMITTPTTLSAGAAGVNATVATGASLVMD